MIITARTSMNTGDVLIRPYHLKDVRALSRLQKELTQSHFQYHPKYYLLAPHSREEFERFLRSKMGDKNFRVYVAEWSRQKLVGYIMGWIEKRPPIYRFRQVGYLSNIFVVKAQRSRRVGEKLFDELAEWFK